MLKINNINYTPYIQKDQRAKTTQNNFDFPQKDNINEAYYHQMPKTKIMKNKSTGINEDEKEKLYKLMDFYPWMLERIFEQPPSKRTLDWLEERYQVMEEELQIQEEYIQMHHFAIEEILEEENYSSKYKSYKNRQDSMQQINGQLSDINECKYTIILYSIAQRIFDNIAREYKNYCTQNELPDISEIFELKDMEIKALKDCNCP